MNGRRVRLEIKSTSTSTSRFQRQRAGVPALLRMGWSPIQALGFNAGLEGLLHPRSFPRSRVFPAVEILENIWRDDLDFDWPGRSTGLLVGEFFCLRLPGLVIGSARFVARFW